jgi:hypothetical protein
MSREMLRGIPTFDKNHKELHLASMEIATHWDSSEDFSKNLIFRDV